MLFEIQMHSFALKIYFCLKIGCKTQKIVVCYIIDISLVIILFDANCHRIICTLRKMKEGQRLINRRLLKVDADSKCCRQNNLNILRHGNNWLLPNIAICSGVVLNSRYFYAKKSCKNAIRGGNNHDSTILHRSKWQS